VQCHTRQKLRKTTYIELRRKSKKGPSQKNGPLLVFYYVLADYCLVIVVIIIVMILAVVIVVFEGFESILDVLFDLASV